VQTSIIPDERVAVGADGARLSQIRLRPSSGEPREMPEMRVRAGIFNGFVLARRMLAD
jgi:hypothetical protein